MTENPELGSSALPVLLHLKPGWGQLCALQHQEHPRLRGNRSLVAAASFVPCHRRSFFQSAQGQLVEGSTRKALLYTSDDKTSPNPAWVSRAGEMQGAKGCQSPHKHPETPSGASGPETSQTNTAAVGEAVGGSLQGRRAQEAPRSEKMLEKGPAKNTMAE